MGSVSIQIVGDIQTRETQFLFKLKLKVNKFVQKSKKFVEILVTEVALNKKVFEMDPNERYNFW